MSLKGLLVATVAVCVGSAAVAEPVWDKVDFDMKRPDVEALYPQGSKIKWEKKQIEISHVAVTDKCEAESNIFFTPDGAIDKIIVNGNPSMGGRCSDAIMSALASKYGEPLNKDTSSGSILARQGKIMVWNRPGGVTMRFKKFENGGLGGGGLLKASWELTYTKSGTAITL